MIWYLRGSGSDNNGGTSANVIARGRTVIAATTTVNDPSAQFTQSMVGQGIGFGTATFRLITAVTNSTHLTFSGGTLSGTFDYVIGGALQTIAQFTNNNAPLAVGDTVYIGAGTYRSAALFFGNTSGVAGNPVSWVGDVDGSHTGDPGEVIISGFSNGDNAAPTSGVLLQFQNVNYMSFSNITFIAGTGAMISSSANGFQGMTFTDCIFNMLVYAGGANWSTPTLTGNRPMHLLLDRCVLWNTGNGLIGANFPYSAVGTPDWDVDVMVRNSLLFLGGQVSMATTASPPGGGRPGGFRFHNSTLIGATTLLNANGVMSSKIPTEVYNCILITPQVAMTATAQGMIVEDYNTIYAVTPRQNVSIGAHSVSNSSRAPLLELGQSAKLRGAQVMMALPFLAPTGSASVMLGVGAGSAAIGAGSAGASGITSDWLGRPRPAGGLSSAHAVGYMEYHDFANADSTANDSPSAAILRGPGDQYVQIPVDGNASATISIYVRYDGYASAWGSAAGGSGVGGLPSVTLLANGELGVAAQTQVCTAAGNAAYQQLTFNTIYPSKPGWVTLQVQSFDNNGPPSAPGLVRFDTVGVT